MSEQSMELFNAVDLIDNLEAEVKKARVMIGTLTLDYFNKNDSEDKKDHWKILYDFPHYATCAEILTDIIHAMYKEINEYRRESEVIENGKVS